MKHKIMIKKKFKIKWKIILNKNKQIKYKVYNYHKTNLSLEISSMIQ